MQKQLSGNLSVEVFVFYADVDIRYKKDFQILEYPKELTSASTGMPFLQKGQSFLS